MELAKGMLLSSKSFQGITITLLEEKGNGWRFHSETNNVKGLWSSRYINSEFDIIDPKGE